jgi:hypothetical protein
MTNSLLSSSSVLRSCALALALATPALGQIAQDHPELCGKLHVPLPLGLTATASSDAGGSAELVVTLDDGSLAKIETYGADLVQQVCPLSQNRLLVFSPTNNDGYDIRIVNKANGAVIDSFLTRTPLASPDQHWLVYREFSAPSTDLPITEQYRLYDLTKDASGNQVPGVDYLYVGGPGRTIYPVTPNHAPFESPGVLPEEVHEFPSDSFHWSPDSKSVAFVDLFASRLAIVVVRLAGEDLTAFVHPLSASKVCDDDTVGIAQVTVTRMEVASTQETIPQVWVELEVPCGARTLTLRAKDFSLAKTEVHAPKIRRPAVGIKKQ